MSAPRVFVSDRCAPGTTVHLDRVDARHLALVLRMKAGDALTVVSERRAWQATLASAKSDGASATIVAQAQQESGELPVDVIVLQAIAKGAKMDEVIEKVVELGAARIAPVRCARSYGGESERKVERWRRIARAAAQQSRRLIVPTVDAPENLCLAVERFAKNAHIIVCHEQAPKGSLAAALHRSGNRPIAVTVGPEGSFTEEELKVARAAGSDMVSLGPTVLRTETAAAALIAAIAAIKGWW